MKTAFESFIEPARARSGMWRPVVGLGLISIGAVVWLVVVLIGFSIVNVLRGMSLSAALDAIDPVATPSDPWWLILHSFLFVGIWLSAWLVVKFLHRQYFSTLFAPVRSFKLRDFFDGLLLAIAFWLVKTFPVVLVYGLPDRSALALSNWMIALLPMIVGLVIQAGAEELVFRGYLLQQLAARWRNPIAWAGVTSVLFVIYHVPDNLFYIVWLFAYGFVSAALVWRTGSLLAPIGLHFGVNLFSFSGVGHEWARPDESQLFVFQGSGMSVAMTSQVAAMVLLLLFVVSPFFPRRQSARS